MLNDAVRVRCDESSCYCRLKVYSKGEFRLLLTRLEFEAAFELSHALSGHVCEKTVTSSLNQIDIRNEIVPIYYDNGRTDIRRLIDDCLDCQLFDRLAYVNKPVHLACVYPAFKYHIIDFTTVHYKQLLGFIDFNVQILNSIEPFSKYCHARAYQHQRSDNVIEFIQELRAINPQCTYIKAR